MKGWGPTLGAGLATVADAYLRSLSPQAQLEREDIAAKRALLPLTQPVGMPDAGLPPRWVEK
jgi:hypothetical protein